MNEDALAPIKCLFDKFCNPRNVSVLRVQDLCRGNVPPRKCEIFDTTVIEHVCCLQSCTVHNVWHLVREEKIIVLSSHGITDKETIHDTNGHQQRYVVCIIRIVRRSRSSGRLLLMMLQLVELLLLLLMWLVLHHENLIVIISVDVIGLLLLLLLLHHESLHLQLLQVLLVL